MTCRPQHIFGIHEFGGEQHILDAGRTGWIVDTVALKDNPRGSGQAFGKDWTGWDSRGLAILCRLNWGYEPDGTIPYSREYDEFARRCAAFVEASVGCSRWIIGNEMNAVWERPGGREQGEVITPALYATCYRQVRAAIQAVQPEAEVIVGAVAPWNNQTKYEGNPNGNWMSYYWTILGLLRDGCDGIALHAYTHQHDANLVYSEAKMGGEFGGYRYEFRAYQDFMTLIPKELMDVPVYITETDADEAWRDENNGWVRAAYGEINWWNEQPGHQQIRALCLYRWPQIDQWYIEGKNGVVEDFRQALGHDYRWRSEVEAEVEDAKKKPNRTKIVQVRLNVRRSAGYVEKPAGDVVMVLAPGTEVSVHGGPVEVDGLHWYEIGAPGVEGLVWAAERAPSGVELLLDAALGGDLVSELAAEHGVREDLVRAVLAVESGGSGFRKGRLLVRFEPRVYLKQSRLPRAVFDLYFRIGESYDEDMYRSTPDEEFVRFHGDQDLEWHALEVACRINMTAGWKSASYGGPQIMGFNAERAGYEDVYEMVEAFKSGDDEQVRAMFRLLSHLIADSGNGRVNAMQCLRDGDLWGFARRYNGEGQEALYGGMLSERTGIVLVEGKRE